MSLHMPICISSLEIKIHTEANKKIQPSTHFNVRTIEHIVKIVKQNQIKSEAYCYPFTSKPIFLEAWIHAQLQLMTINHVYEC